MLSLFILPLSLAHCSKNLQTENIQRDTFPVINLTLLFFNWMAPCSCVTRKKNVFSLYSSAFSLIDCQISNAQKIPCTLISSFRGTAFDCTCILPSPPLLGAIGTRQKALLTEKLLTAHYDWTNISIILSSLKYLLIMILGIFNFFYVLWFLSVKHSICTPLNSHNI